MAFLVSESLAGEIREIELNDGSVIRGEILSMDDNLYTLKSKTLGTIKIEASKIQTIRMATESGDFGDQLEEIQKSMMNAEILGMILSLNEDPEVLAALQDPSIMEALNSNDMKGLISNPRFITLLNNPKVMDIVRKALE